MHLTSSPVDWYAARAAGIVAYVLLSIVVALGLVLSGRRRLERWPRFALEDVHRFAGILTGSFLALHVLTVAIDSYTRFSLAQLVVPFTSSYRPLPVALGTVSAELLVAVGISNRFRARGLSYRAWRRIHYLGFAVWGFAALHGVTAGTDRGSGWLVALYATTIAAICGLLAARAPHYAAWNRTSRSAASS